jgi:hypothetical protein
VFYGLSLLPPSGSGRGNCRPTQQLADLPDFNEVKPWHVPPFLACHLEGSTNIRRINVRSADNTIIGCQAEATIHGHGTLQVPEFPTLRVLIDEWLQADAVAGMSLKRDVPE